MCVYICVYIYIYMYMYIYLYIYVCVCVCVCVCVSYPLRWLGFNNQENLKALVKESFVWKDKNLHQLEI